MKRGPAAIVAIVGGVVLSAVPALAAGTSTTWFKENGTLHGSQAVFTTPPSST